MNETITVNIYRRKTKSRDCERLYFSWMITRKVWLEKVADLRKYFDIFISGYWSQLETHRILSVKVTGPDSISNIKEINIKYRDII